MSSTPELYVYYTLEPERADAVQAAFGQLRVSLHRHLPGLQSRLLKRPGAEGLQTWMEVHTWPQGAVPPHHWQDRIEQLAQALSALLAGPRHQELFEPLQ